jgi:hypothetical protein
MADEGTVAVMEPDTGTQGEAAVAEAPIEAPQAEAPLSDVKETEAPDAGETESPEPVAPAPLTQADIDRAREDAAREAREAMQQEQAAQVAEATRNYQRQMYEQAQAQAAQQRNGAAVAQLRNFGEWVAKRVENGEDWTQALDHTVLDKVGGRVAQMLDAEKWDQSVSQAIGAVERRFPGYKPELSTAQQLQQVIYGRHDYGALVDGIVAMASEANKQINEPEMRAAIRKELEKEVGAAGRLDSAAAAQQRANGERPTNIGGGPPSPYNPSAVLTSDNASLSEKRQAFKAKHGYEPDY